MCIHKIRIVLAAFKCPLSGTLPHNAPRVMIVYRGAGGTGQDLQRLLEKLDKISLLVTRHQAGTTPLAPDSWCPGTDPRERLKHSHGTGQAALGT